MKSVRWILLGLLCGFPLSTLQAQTDFISPEVLREQMLSAYAEPIVMVNAMDKNRGGDAATRPSLMEMLLERWGDACDPEIPIAYSQAGPEAKGDTSAAQPEKKKKWYDKIGLRGYTQMRYSFTTDEAPNSAAPQVVSDRSVSPNQSFLIRRARLILFGDVSDHVYVYLQPDFAVTPNGSVDSIEFAQIRDWYADWYFDKDKIYRLRMGQSKVPYGWENMQSSSNRISLDRTDGLNSAVRNERDIGLFFYYTPVAAQKFFADVLEKGLKGSGNYGVVALGVYNGQGGSIAEQNDNVHTVARLTLPMQLDNCQYVEMAVQAYTGFFTVLSSQIRANGAGPLIRPTGTLETGNTRGWLDQRIAGTLVWYPQPLGFQAEWNVGRGPALNASQTAIEDRPINGGYSQVMYRLDAHQLGILFPYTRWSYFQGGYKNERNAPYTKVNEWEVGLEWQFNPQIELTTAYNITNRTNTTARTDANAYSYGQFEGQLLRFQFQFNY